MSTVAGSDARSLVATEGSPLVRCAASLLVALAIVVLGSEKRATADPGDAKEACRAGYEQGQVDRSRGHLRAAATEFRACSGLDCAPFMRSDCTRWIDEVAADMPSLVVVARSPEGQDLADARVFVDGEPQSDRTAGMGFEVDPGPHVLRVEARGAETTAVQVVVRVGDKERRVEVTLPPIAATEPTARPLWPAYAFSGLAIVGLGTFATFAILGYSTQQDRAQHCSPSCTDAQVDPIRTDYRVADIGLGVGLVSVAVAAYFIVTRGSASSPSARVGAALRPAPGGAALTF
jgi:hypothetical protein